MSLRIYCMFLSVLSFESSILALESWEWELMWLKQPNQNLLAYSRNTDVEDVNLELLLFECQNCACFSFQ